MWTKLAGKLLKGVKATCDVKKGLSVFQHPATTIRRRRSFLMIKRVLVIRRKLNHCAIRRTKLLKRLVLREWQQAIKKKLKIEQKYNVVGQMVTPTP